MSALIDLTGKVFGRLTVIKRVENITSGKHKTRQSGNARWLCRCECGNVSTVVGKSLKSGGTKSCGCLKNLGAPHKDLTNEVFGHLTVIERAEDYIMPSGQNKVGWLCRCECGIEKRVRSESLVCGDTKSCGNYKCFTTFKDLTGKVFGRLTVIKRVENDNRGGLQWLCRCECGTEKTVASQLFKSGNTRSCGCFQKEQVALHSRKRPLEATFNKLCSQAFKRGIPVGISYEDYINFTKHDKCHYCHKPLIWNMYRGSSRKTRPSEAHNLDRKDNTKGYTVDNCVECCAWCNRHKLDDCSYETFYAMTEKFRTGELSHELAEAA